MDLVVEVLVVMLVVVVLVTLPMLMEIVFVVFVIFGFRKNIARGLDDWRLLLSLNPQGFLGEAPRNSTTENRNGCYCCYR